MTAQSPNPTSSWDEAVWRELCRIPEGSSITWEDWEKLNEERLKRITQLANRQAEQRAVEAVEASNTYNRGKRNGAVLVLDELKRDVMAVAQKYDDETNTVWLGNINRLRGRVLQSTPPKPICEAQAMGALCGRPVEVEGQQCDYHDPKRKEQADL